MEFEYKDSILKKRNGVDIDEEKLKELESMIYKKYIKFIRSLCFNYSQSYRDDLIQSGIIGLFKGIEKLEDRYETIKLFGISYQKRNTII